MFSDLINDVGEYNDIISVLLQSCSRKGFTGRRKHSVLTFSYDFQSVDFFVKSNLSGEDWTDHNKEDTEDTVHEA